MIHLDSKGALGPDPAIGRVWCVIRIDLGGRVVVVPEDGGNHVLAQENAQ